MNFVEICMFSFHKVLPEDLVSNVVTINSMKTDGNIIQFTGAPFPTLIQFALLKIHISETQCIISHHDDTYS